MSCSGQVVNSHLLLSENQRCGRFPFPLCESHNLSPTTCCYLTACLGWSYTNITERVSVLQPQKIGLRCCLFQSVSCSFLFFFLLQVLLQVIGVIAVAAVILPWILIPVVPLFAVFLFLRFYFLQTSRDIKRLESTSNYYYFFLLVALARPFAA